MEEERIKKHKRDLRGKLYEKEKYDENKQGRYMRQGKGGNIKRIRELIEEQESRNKMGYMWEDLGVRSGGK